MLDVPFLIHVIDQDKKVPIPGPQSSTSADALFQRDGVAGRQLSDIYVLRYVQLVFGEIAWRGGTRSTEWGYIRFQ